MAGGKLLLLGTIILLVSVVGILSIYYFRSPPRSSPRDGAVLQGGAIVAFSPGYRISFYGIEYFHSFDILKPQHIADHLVRTGLLSNTDFAVPGEVDEVLLAEVHDPAYLVSLTDYQVLSRALEVRVPGIFSASAIERRVLAPFRRQVQGSIVAARGALEYGLGINLGGGFHHAHYDMGHGFCILNDIAVVVHALRKEGLTGTILIIDTDAHQGDGTHAFFQNDPSVFSLSLHQQDIFPHPKLKGDIDVELKAGTNDSEFLSALENALDQVPRDLAFIIHVAGSDVLFDDPLTNLLLTPEGLIARDMFVLRWSRQRNIPLLHLLSGGYGPSSANAQADSIAAMLREIR